MTNLNLKKLVALALALAIGALASPAAFAGRLGGPVDHIDRVLSRDVDVYDLWFRAGQRARVVVDGDGDTDLDVYVYDENGNLIDSDTDYTDYCLVSWNPRWTGEFRIEIHNLGGVYNRYRISVN